MDVLLDLLQSVLEAPELALFGGDRATERLQLLRSEFQAAGGLLELDGELALLLLALADLSEQKVELLQDVKQFILSGLSLLHFLAERPQPLTVSQLTLESHVFTDGVRSIAETLWRRLKMLVNSEFYYEFLLTFFFNLSILNDYFYYLCVL